LYTPITAVASAAFLLLSHAPAFAQTELDCLTEAVLAESTLAKEPIEGDQIVAYSIYLRSTRTWGPGICTTIGRRYAKSAYRSVKIKKKGARKAYWVQKPYTAYVYDYSYKGIAAYRDIIKKVAPALVERARVVAGVQLAGGYQPPEGFEEALHYMYAEKSSKNGAHWFECVAKPLGKVSPLSVHVMYRSSTDDELAQTLQERPECKRFIEIDQLDRARRAAPSRDIASAPES
jgi:hypothetical protein